MRPPQRAVQVAALSLVLGLAFVLGADAPSGRFQPDAVPDRASLPKFDPFITRSILESDPATDSIVTPTSPAPLSSFLTTDLGRSAQTVALFALISLAPIAVLMATAYVRIQIVLTLVRQALGSPQVPGNQVLMALAFLLTALVMAPAAELVYERGVAPYAAGRATAGESWKASTEPIKAFMVDQILRTQHESYLVALNEYHRAGAPSSAPQPSDCMDLPLRVVAPAFLLSELTTALWIGFIIYLPFLIIDLVVAAVLAAMGLVSLAPAQVAMPLKLVLFVLADGWWLVAEALLKTFTIGSG